MTDAEIQKMKQEAQANADADKAVKERAEKINQADSMIFQTEKQLKDYGDKLSSGNLETIKAAHEKLKNAHKSQDLSAIDAAVAELNNAWQAASQEMYQGGAAQNPNSNASNNSNADTNQNTNQNQGDNTTDVEYEEVKK